MGIFDRFPYSSTHEMNLDFMLGKATEIAEDMQQVTAGMEQVQAGLTAISEKTEQATQAAAQAAASASSIEGSVTAAEEAAKEAQMHNESAQTWANNAMTYKADCQRSATEAAASSSSAAQAATAAAASEDTVATYAQAANASAQSAANNNDSAHQYANQASASASNATFHSSNAQTAATNAQTAATNANTSATNASASADRAASLKTDVETLVESLPEDFTDLNNTVNQLSDAIKVAKNTVGAKFADYFPNTDPALTFNTTNHTVKIAAGYMILNTNERISVTEQTIDYYPTSTLSLTTLLLVYDTSTSSFKPVYAYNTTNGYNPQTQFIIASFHTTYLAQNGIATSNCSYIVDGKYHRGLVEEFTDDPTFVRVCTYNMGMYNYGVNSDDMDAPAAIAKCNKFFNSHPFDILGLQENKQQLSTYSVQTAIYDNWYKNHYGYDRWAWIESTYSISDTHTGTFTSAIPGNGRPYVYGTITVGTKELFVVVIHMATDATDRATNYSELFTLCSGHSNVIVLGDFNAGVGGGDVQTEFDQITAAGYKIANGGILGLLETTEAGATIDNIMVSKNIYIRNIGVPDVYDVMCSDHLPLIAELVIY